jgi:NADPH:quinone reductase-like Zn-dependent oxidoreductase
MFFDLRFVYLQSADAIIHFIMNEYPIPQKMRAIVLQDYSSNLGRVLRSLVVTEKELRPLREEEVLVRIEAAPCNPSDIAFIRGLYNIIKKVPVVPGFEATGKVVATGNDPLAAGLLDKRVSCFSQDDSDGTWAEYHITSPSFCIPVKPEMAAEQAACLSINPFTALGLLELAKKDGHQVIIQNAAAGQIGSFVRKLAADDDLRVINIVRSDEHVQLLQQQGERMVLNLRDDGFEKELGKLAHDLNALLAFDAVGGEMTGQILNAMPPGARLILYGGLAGQQVSNINVLGVIFDNKSLTGFNLGQWISQIPPGRFDELSANLQDKIIRGDIRTRIQAKYPLDLVVKGLLQYIGHMSDGKVLFVP